MKIKALIIFILSLLTCRNFTYGQTQNTAHLERQIKLDSIFPIDNIVKINVANLYGKHTLTNEELFKLKGQLKRSKFAGGLLLKPGHIFLEFQLRDKSIIKPGFVYASLGQIHFENAIDKFNEKFSGTFILPHKFNFDNYK